MAYTTLSTVSAGSVLTATAYNNLIANNVMGQPTFTNEAARDAAITAPEEGMRAYLTAPTVPAATGTSTHVPTGVTTIYNGSVWVCTTEVGASSATSGTTTSTSYVTTLTGDATAQSVTLVTGTTALISISSTMGNAAAGFVNSLAVSVSGATTYAASDTDAAYANHNAGYWSPTTRVFILGGLTAGTNTFTLAYKVSGNTGTFDQRAIVVKGVA